MSPAQSPEGSHYTINYLLLRALSFVAVVGICWVILFIIDNSLPYIRSGAQLIYDGKIEKLVSSSEYFSHNDRNRVAVFGNSKILTGFIPEEFDVAASGSTISLNLGLPDVNNFILQYLQTLLEGGQIPTHVILTLPWPKETTDSSFFNPLGADLIFFDSIFPFRQFPHDLSYFLRRAPKYGGLVPFYKRGRNEVSKMLRQRGYYLISSDSKFPDQGLPSNFTIAGDRADKTMTRNGYNFSGSTYTTLLRLASQYDFKLIVFPIYVRGKQFAPRWITDETQTVAHTNKDGVVIVEPPFISIENRYFSDPEHLNPEGASLYTNYVLRVFNANDLWSD
jgi:hypothetical protein